MVDNNDKRLSKNKDINKDTEVDIFLRKIAATPQRRPIKTQKRGRLLFTMDATASRQPTWDRAATLQSEMFLATQDLGGLEIQLAFYRGFREFKCSPWLTKPEDLAGMMSSVMCLAGETQIEKVLRHTIDVVEKEYLNALVFVGDCLEEDIDMLGKFAGKLGLLGVPIFLFHEGNDPIAAFGFRQISKLSGGAYCRFDISSPKVLKNLLGAVAVYAAGGKHALENHARGKDKSILQLSHQINNRRI